MTQATFHDFNTMLSALLDLGAEAGNPSLTSFLFPHFSFPINCPMPTNPCKNSHLLGRGPSPIHRPDTGHDRGLRIRQWLSANMPNRTLAAVGEDACPSVVMTTQLPRLSWRITTDDDLVIFSFDPRILGRDQVCTSYSFKAIKMYYISKNT